MLLLMLVSVADAERAGAAGRLVAVWYRAWRAGSRCWPVPVSQREPFFSALRELAVRDDETACR